MNSSHKKATKADVVIEVLLWIVGIIVLFPILNVFLSSFKSADQLYDFFAIPSLTYLDNYKQLFSQVNVPRSFMISVLITVSSVFFNVLFTSMAGYVIGRSKKGFFQKLYYYFMLGLIVPTTGTMAIKYKMAVDMHLINTIPFLILLYISGPAYQLMLYVGYIKSIPRELEEAAKIDGCGYFSIFSKVVFPLMRPATGTIIATTLFWYWNDFSTPLIFLSGSKNTDTLIMGIYKFQLTMGGVNMGPVFALVVISTIPAILAFSFAQKHLLNGLVVGSLKG